MSVRSTVEPASGRKERELLDARFAMRLSLIVAQSDMESMRDAQGNFLEQLMGDRIQLLTERVQ